MPLNVGIVTPRYPPTMHGGGEVSVQLLAEQLQFDDRIQSVRVYSLDGSKRETLNGVQVHRLADVPTNVFEVGNTLATVMLRRRTDISSLDILHGYNVTLNPTVGYIGKTHDTATVATLNSYDCFPKAAIGIEPSVQRRLYELVAMSSTGRILHKYAKQTDAFIALSRATRNVYRENGYTETRIEVIGNMYDPSFKPVSGHPEEDRTNVLYVGSLIPEKGVKYLVRAVAALPEEFKLRVVGDGEERKDLETLADALGVADRVVFTGNVPHDQVQMEYARGDVFVHPGIWPEPFGRTLLEAMRSELPVVVTNVGGPADIVPNDKFKCPPRSPSALVDAIQMASKSDAVGPRNRRYVEETYAPDRIRTRVVDVYESIV